MKKYLIPNGELSSVLGSLSTMSEPSVLKYQVWIHLAIKELLR